MKIRKMISHARGRRRGRVSERGTAIIIAVMVMALLAIFVAASVSRATNETLMMSNDQANTAAYFVAQASLEHMSRNFSEVFDVKPVPTTADIARINADLPTGYDDYGIAQDLRSELPAGTPPETTVIDVGSPFAGLVALREGWRLNTTVIGPTKAEVRLTRTLNNYLIPIFQFGIFYDDPMEHHPGPNFNFGGRVHTNSDIFMQASAQLRFRDRVTAAGEVVTDYARNGFYYDHWGSRAAVNRGDGVYVNVTEGSVRNGPDTPERKAERGGVDDPDLQDGTRNPNWTTFSAAFRGNLIARAPLLQLPLQIEGASPIEIIKRSVPGETIAVRDNRYYNKPGLRITLSNSQAQLPGATGGVQLNATVQPNAVNQVPGGASGYWPTPRGGGIPQATRVNGYRLTPVPGREVWIKIETVSKDSSLNPVAVDVTESILSLGVTQYVRIGGVDFGDPDAIVKLQRFAMNGPPPRVAGTWSTTSNVTPGYTFLADAASQRSALNRNVYTYVPGATTPQGLSVVATPNWYVNGIGEQNFEYPLAPTAGPSLTTYNPRAGAAPNTTTTAPTRLIPFPIMMFDTREGLFNDDLSSANWSTLYHPAGSQRVPVNGVMGMIDFDVNNFRRLVSGAFGTLPGGFSGASIPDNDGVGWIVYFSDRRNDVDNDGQYDNENVYVGDNDALAEVTDASDTTSVGAGEDVNNNGLFDVSYDNAGTGVGESATYNIGREADVAAVTDTPWFRRAQRLINAARLPESEFKGFTVASENAIYVQGNYNATHVTAVGTPTPFDGYRNSLGPMVPASIVADGITLLSNEWNDGKSFRWAYAWGDNNTAADGRQQRTALTIRAALLMGDTRSSLVDTVTDMNSVPNVFPNQGGGDESLSGGVHNFPRFREQMDTVSYCGSLINLFNSTGNNGTFKCCAHVYSPPTRNWVFDTNFLDPRRLPPGTPFFQYVHLTGFRRSYTQDT
jgi:hypothetical protein